jgi:hypothetical protein
MQIAALRRVLDDGRAEGSCIQTLPGRGYRFVAPVTRVEPAAPAPSTPPSGNGSGAPIAENGQLRGREAASPLCDKPPEAALPRHYRPTAGIVGTVILALGLVAAATAWNWRSPWSGEARPAPRLSIVVLPFTNLSDDREQQYFADGITEDLTADLSQIADSFVISRNTAFTYKDKPVNAKQIRPRARCALCARRQRPAVGQAGSCQRPADRRRDRRASLGGAVRARHR